ncbi:MAG: NAD(P)H-hydrate dehydratase [Gemmatimonadota bacterium]|nr:NAD(P)H-hydrate dehydratase [Gemmatimonadota bacterium]
MPVNVTNAEESLALDSAAIASGIPSRALMRSAAFNAATVVCARYGIRMRQGVTVFTGAGNNGGDGWALAGALSAAGASVQVREIAESVTPDAIAERAGLVHLLADNGVAAGVVVDAVAGTGARGKLREPLLSAAAEIAGARKRGAEIVALDLPSGVDASDGATEGCVVADLTISFGSCKRGSLVSRGACGEIVIVDIGLPAGHTDLPQLIDAAFVRSAVPTIAADAFKGTRKSVAMVAGGENMGGAAILAATAALRSGVGLVQVITAPANISAMHTQIPEALVAPLDKAYSTIEHWADAVLIGPGLATDDRTREFIRDLVRRWRGPVVLDAGALTAFDEKLDLLGELLCGRPAIITPHPGELSRLLGRDISDVLANRFDIGTSVARQIGATVILKGTPTVVFDPDGARFVVATGTPVLATGGSGDALSGIVATLLAQGCQPSASAACAAWIHGRAGELTPGIRGYRMSDVLEQLPAAWRLAPSAPSYPVLVSLPAVA